MSTLVAFHKIGRTGPDGETPRIWLESRRLETAGFPARTAFEVKEIPRGLVIVRGGSRNVSSRAGKSPRPIIELTGNQIMRALNGVDTIKAKASFGRIEIRATIRAAAILRAKSRKAPFRALELFAGGGTLSDAIGKSPALRVIGGAEIEAAYADAWASKHPEAELLTGDIRLMHPAELPAHDILVAGIPCTSHSTMGRAKKKLAGRPEEGDTGDLFAWVLAAIAHRPPLATVFENVPAFAGSLAASVLRSGLIHLGYHIHETILEPYSQWGEPSDRRRWVMVATLNPGFEIRPPVEPERVLTGECLDTPNDVLDALDAARIAKTIEGLKAHNARHAALGHGFAFTTITRDSERIPTIPKSYHKINTGPFVETPHGPRLLRLHEAEAIMGARAGTPDYSTGIQILGQGVQTRLWGKIFEQLGDFLENPETRATSPEHPPQMERSQSELDLGLALG